MAGKNKPAKRGSSADLADILMITTRRVNQLVDEEVLAREPEGDFILPTAVAAYYEYKYADKDETTYLTEKPVMKRQNVSLRSWNCKSAEMKCTMPLM